jgi:hypothetical protein
MGRAPLPLHGGKMNNQKDLVLLSGVGPQKWPRRSGAKSWEEDTHLRA